ncbi:Tn3 family transposase [Clostridioides sp. ES-S-0123-01]|uniref:transposase n=1 Tax=Clostridioides sp. ES-S-0123-01 TaxID=2770783 RepID=UPI001D0FBA4C|nr:Tn3 family transposase [Clostridioides sp. ES-S-0123-01]
MPEILYEVNKWINFLEDFRGFHNDKLEKQKVLVASLLADGHNLGFAKMSIASGVDEFALRRASEFYLNYDNLSKAQQTLVNYHHSLCIVKNWGSGQSSSSDGMRVPINSKTIYADYNAHYGIRKQDHYVLINKLLNLGDKLYVETMSYKRLQIRAKNTTINEKTGRISKKKCFGKSLANKAPSMFLIMLDNKLKYNGEKLYKIDTTKCKASQYNHFLDEYNKKELKDRWNKGMYIQRDCYSAFLIMNVNDDLKSINREISRLKKLKLNGYKLISSMGI